jgi:xylan 1,4-beta-xylosidase
MHTIQNPILPGFHPDPSIIRVGEDYYIATSTFEWFPGVEIHHSKDLIHWRLLTHAVTRPSQINMLGNPDSCGIWAPALSYDQGIYYLIYTDVKTRAMFKDAHNYLITATDIMGPWSDPIYLNSSGFDPSLFHDDDGRKWLVNMLWDLRPNNNHFAGIVLQEYSTEQQKLIGSRKNIFKGTELAWTEGPHLYKREGYYYLVTAEGGTMYNHAVTMARSTSIDGTYEVDPNNPILTSAGNKNLELQKAGHASIVETQTGEWYMVHLAGRPIKDKYCTLGRETAIQKCEWTEEGWLRLSGGGNQPFSLVTAPKLPLHPFKPQQEKDDFNEAKLDMHWNSLRVPPNEAWLTLKERPGYLRLRGMESMHSNHQQSLIARRQQSFQCEAETLLEFEPEHYQQMAGLILYYDTKDYVYLRMSRDEVKGKSLNILHSTGGQVESVLEEDVSIEGAKQCALKLVVDKQTVQFMYSTDQAAWHPIGGLIEITHLSDDFGERVRFTGTYIGLCAQDLSGTRKPADFDYFIYREFT